MNYGITSLEPWCVLACHWCDSRTRRGQRYYGQSSMSFISLVRHGVSAMSVFGDIVFIRLTIACLGISIGAVAAALAAVVVRVSTDWAVPGWATMVIGLPGSFFCKHWPYRSWPC